MAMEKDNGGSRPDPDPTLLSTQQTIREQDALKELVLSIVDGKFSVIDTRLSGMDTAIKLVREDSAKFPEFARDQVNQLRELHGEKFNSINTQFNEVDKRTTQLSTADKTAAAAALQAAKEAVGAQNTSNSTAIAKSETATVAAIKQLQPLFNTANAATNDKINDLKSRLDRGEGKTSVSDPAVADAVRVMSASLTKMQEQASQAAGRGGGIGDSVGWIIGVGGALAGVIMLGELLLRH